LYFSELEKWDLDIYQYVNHRIVLRKRVRSLTVRDRILLHLANFGLNETDHWAPTQVSQKGIATGVGISAKHVHQYVRPMINEGLVKESSSYIQGGKQHQKVYFLTNKGREAAKWMSHNTHDNRPLEQGINLNENTIQVRSKVVIPSFYKKRRMSRCTERIFTAR
jgi:predicted transcriptional regulator